MDLAEETFARNLDWNLLKVFHEIAQSGGVTPAARKLSRKQPALSLALKRLETRIGARLCRRGPGGFELTDEGQLVAEICAAASRLTRQIPARVGGLVEQVTGRVRIALVGSLAHPQLDAAIAAFHTDHPQAEIALELAGADSVASAVLRGAADIGLAPARLRHVELHYEPLFHDVHRPYCGRNHPLFGKLAAEPAALADEPIILTGAEEPDALVKLRQRHGIGRVVAGVCEQLDAAKRLTILGIGLCFLPDGFVAADVAEGRLWPVLRQLDELTSEIVIITAAKAPPLAARQRFLEILRQHLPPEAGPLGLSEEEVAQMRSQRGLRANTLRARAR
jgi:LysR family transcriptional regulator, transcriptional activator for bauABCD operon